MPGEIIVGLEILTLCLPSAIVSVSAGFHSCFHLEAEEYPHLADGSPPLVGWLVGYNSTMSCTVHDSSVT